MPKISLRTILIGVFIALLLLALLGWKAGCDAAKTAKDEAALSQTVGTQLDKVSGQTAVVRQEQTEKTDEVDKIEGSDQRLPDGYGAELERVRRGR